MSRFRVNQWESLYRKRHTVSVKSSRAQKTYHSSSTRNVADLMSCSRENAKRSFHARGSFFFAPLPRPSVTHGELNSRRSSIVKHGIERAAGEGEVRGVSRLRLTSRSVVVALIIRTSAASFLPTRSRSCWMSNGKSVNPFQSARTLETSLSATFLLGRNAKRSHLPIDCGIPPSLRAPSI